MKRMQLAKGRLLQVFVPIHGSRSLIWVRSCTRSRYTTIAHRVRSATAASGVCRVMNSPVLQAPDAQNVTPPPARMDS
jgi:hypothetical protein